MGSKRSATVAAPVEREAPSDDDWITVQEVADLLRIHRRTVYQRLATDPDFPRPFHHLKHLRWKRAPILEHRAKIEAQVVEFGQLAKFQPRVRGRAGDRQQEANKNSRPDR